MRALIEDYFEEYQGRLHEILSAAGNADEQPEEENMQEKEETEDAAY